MLEEFLRTHRDAIISRTRTRSASRMHPAPKDDELAHGIPIFLEQLGTALRLARTSDLVDHESISSSAAHHGNDLLRLGLSIAQVVHAYGDVCQAVTEMAVELSAPISAEEFRTLNLCLDDAIAGAVTEHSRQREHAIAEHGSERLGVFAHELRNLLNIAALSFEMIKSGQVPSGGSTGVMHERSLGRMRDLVDRSLADVRLDAGIEHLERIEVAEFVEEVEIGAIILAKARNVSFTATATAIDGGVTIKGDRQVLAAALTNLLQNAFKFTKPRTKVTLTARATTDRVFFEVEDECGGLPVGKVEELFQPFSQRGSDRSGLGLGLSICVKAAEANGGQMRVRDLPGKGCVFTLDLPRPPPRPHGAPESERTVDPSSRSEPASRRARRRSGSPH